MDTAPPRTGAKDFLSILDLTYSELERLLDIAAEMKAARARRREAPTASVLAGLHVALLFEKPSLRTRSTFEIAVRDIKAGEEVVCDYGSFNLEEPLDCACGSPHCRGRISPDDIENVAPKLDGLVRAAFRDIPSVSQPLWNLVQKYRLQIERGIAQPSHLPSLIENRWPRVPVEAPARQRRASRAKNF